MSSAHQDPQRLVLARELIREKGLSRQDLELLDEIFRLGSTDLNPLLQPGPIQEEAPPELPSLSALRRTFGLFLVFLEQLPERKLGDARDAIGHVIQEGLSQLASQAHAAHLDLLAQHREPAWVVHVLELIAALRTTSTALGAQEPGPFRSHWHTFLQEHREPFRDMLQVLSHRQDGPHVVLRLNQLLKTLNQSLSTGTGRPQEHIRRLETLLDSLLPQATRERNEPMLLIQHVIANLKLALIRPLDRGLNWPAVEQARVSLQWLWNNLGWHLPRLERKALDQLLPQDVHGLLRQLRSEQPGVFRIVSRALTSHVTLLGLVEPLPPASSMTERDRLAAVPVFFVVEMELGRLAERVYHPREAQQLPERSESALLLGAFLRQAVLSLLQDQATIRNLLHQALVMGELDQLATTMDNLKALLLNHQRQLMGDLVGLFSAELRQRLFPDSPGLTEEGDRLRQRLRRLWEHLDPSVQQIQLHLELEDWPRLALSLAHTQAQVASFRRSPEFLLIRSQDRAEVDRLTQQFGRMLDNPGDIQRALREGADLAAELLRFLDIFLLRINARVPLIRYDLTSAVEALRIASNLLEIPEDHSERTRMAHRLIQATKPLGVRDPQALQLLKRWIRSERGRRDGETSLRHLQSHLQHLAARLEAALS